VCPGRAVQRDCARCCAFNPAERCQAQAGTCRPCGIAMLVAAGPKRSNTPNCCLPPVNFRARWSAHAQRGMRFFRRNQSAWSTTVYINPDWYARGVGQQVWFSTVLQAGPASSRGRHRLFGQIELPHHDRTGRTCASLTASTASRERSHGIRPFPAAARSPSGPTRSRSLHEVRHPASVFGLPRGSSPCAIGLGVVSHAVWGQFGVHGLARQKKKPHKR